MSKSILPKQVDGHPLSPRETLPTMYDLPSEEIGESGVPDEFHVIQPQLLKETFQPSKYKSEEIFIGIDINFYFDVRHQAWYKRPDWFAVLGVPRLYDGIDTRSSYVIWQEGISPTVVIEFLSKSTEKEDLGKTNREEYNAPTKWQVYETILRIPYYIIFDRITNKIQAFRLEGDSYISFLPNNEQCYEIPSLEMSLGLWQGKYQEVDRLWLRWFNKEGCLIATPLEKETQEKQLALESAEKERQIAERERQIAEKERQIAERECKEKENLAKELEILTAKLKAMGIDPTKL
ncbi:MAG: Uma2 family endonuclease [Acidobacteria bacterium]|nr:Uma2 family endonuclease [Acidobacteriota bacterium]